MTIIHDLLDLPVDVKKSDFVIKLADGVSRPEIVLGNYAVTPDVHAAFEHALRLVAGALRDKQSVAAYIHGSFGSGKSHFMALLSLLLSGDTRAWADPDLHDLKQKFESIGQAKLLRLHLYMAGAGSIESKVFPEYLAKIREAHPDAPVPALFEDGPLFDNARKLRGQLGDDKFFGPMNEAQGTTQGAAAKWSKLVKATTWTATTFEAACASGDPEERGRLFSALVRSHFPAFAQQAHAFVSFGQGLAVIAEHASRLGYAGVALFLDELILWLASIASDRVRLNTEIQKLGNLIEGQDERRSIPVMTFAARQRDVSEMVGDQLAGADNVTLRDNLKWWDGRFETIKLPDKSLPRIIAKRIVRSKNDDSRKRLDEAFTEMRRGLGASWAALLGEDGDEAAFRLVYPFSPALVGALIKLSHVLQRERTALRVLMEMLVAHLDDFRVGHVVPVGDLYDVLAGGEDPMDGTSKERFTAARRLYENDLLPMIQRQNGTGTRERCQRLRDNHPVAIGCSNCAESRCRADNRLAKTLLLASLAPEVPTLRNLTASRLVQLNHGSLRAPVPGTEAALAASRLRDWARQNGKLRVGDQGDPSVMLAVTGVDTQPILDGARLYDRQSVRRDKVREILFQGLGIDHEASPVFWQHLWRGSNRTGLVHYGNVREMDDETLAARSEHDFKIVIDYPFDEAGHAPSEDQQRVAAWMDRGRISPTVVWLPSFFGETVQRDLGDLVVIDSILEGDNWKQHLGGLRPEDQRLAREELLSLAAQKRASVRRAIEAAYGLRKADDKELDAARSIEQHWHVLVPGIDVRGLLASSLSTALADVATSLLDHRYPRHPHFEGKVTRGRLEKGLEWFERLLESEGQRMAVTKQEAAVFDVAGALGLVQMLEGGVALRPHRFDEIDRALRSDGADAPSVRKLHDLFDPKGVGGLQIEVKDFLVLAYARKTGRELLRGSIPVREETFGKLPLDADLVEPRLPQPTEWERAFAVAGKLWGITLPGRARNAKNVRALVERVEEKRRAAVAARAHEIEALLVQRAAFFAGEPPRLLTARRVAELLGRLDVPDPVERIDVLAGFNPSPSSLDAVKRHLDHASHTALVLHDEVLFNAVDALLRRVDDPKAAAVLEVVRRALCSDELLVRLDEALREQALAAQRILHGSDTPPQPPPPPPQGEVVVDRRSVAAVPASGLAAEVERIQEALRSGGERATLTLSWTVVRPKGNE